MSNIVASRHLVWLVPLVAIGGRAAAQPAPEPPPAPSLRNRLRVRRRRRRLPNPAGSTPAPAARPDEEQDPFTFADFTWQTGNARTKDSLLGNQYFTGEFRLDDVFHYSFNQPKDDTIGGSTEAWRHGENQVTQLGIGGDLHVEGVIGRLMTQFGQLATTPPRNDASPSRGQWQLADMYRYLSEAYGGYHVGDPPQPETRVAATDDGRKLAFGVLTFVGAVQVASALPHPGVPGWQTLFGAACFVAGLAWLLRHRES